MKFIESEKKLFSQDEKLHLKNLLIKQYGNSSYAFLNTHILQLSFKNIVSELKNLHYNLGFNVLLDICVVDNLKLKDINTRFIINYLLLNMETKQRLIVKLPLASDDSIYSIRGIWKNAPWLEREVFDLYGIRIRNQKNERLLNSPFFEGHPLKKDFNYSKIKKIKYPPQELDFQLDEKGKENRNNIQWIEMIPNQFRSQAPCRMLFQTLGGEVLKTKVEIGYSHRCVEKIIEEKSLDDITFYMERLVQGNPISGSFAWCKTIEDLLEIEIPSRAQVLRMIFSELSRVSDHFNFLAHLAFQMDSDFVYWRSTEAINLISGLFSLINGFRQGYSLNVIGGVKYNLPFAWTSSCVDVIKQVDKKLKMINKAFGESKFFFDLSQVGKVESADAISHGISGPNLRSCGVNFDIRKSNPYYFYDQIDFEIPLGLNGFIYDRYLVRVEEIRQSFKIVAQLIEHLPHGEILSNDERIRPLPNREEINNNFDGIMKKALNNYVHTGLSLKDVEGYSAIESSNGELGIYVKLSENDKFPDRIKIRSSSLAHLQAFEAFNNNVNIDEAIMNFQSFNINGAEMDR